ncbi:MAG TPA: aspartate-semialdehyde dehydrogenase, partial [Candidatus Saccharimonadales bacterium]|nr:aspartate-semialdehyde dehydrogenase [Candidatus Saccharimonadales bacterium]
KKIPVGILGATGMVGQRFVELLSSHPWFEIKVLAASPRSAGKSYKEAVGEKWFSKKSIPAHISSMIVSAVEEDIDLISSQVELVFSALDLDSEKIRKIENDYVKRGVFVVSNNSAHRWTEDVPMIIPEINPAHLELVNIQRNKLGTKKGGIVVKSNCSIQSYVPVLQALMQFTPTEVIVTTNQAISGAGKTFETWPEMIDNVIPYIGGEEEKSEKEPLKVWGKIKNGKIENAKLPIISATCIRVPVADGHMASVSVKFKNKPTREQIIDAIKKYKNPIEDLNLPSSPKEFLKYFEEENRPQTNLDRDEGSGMTISVGRIRPDSILDYKFVALSHNTLRGAAGGAVLAAELLKAKGYI